MKAPRSPLKLYLKSQYCTSGNATAASFTIHWPNDLVPSTRYSVHLHELFVVEDGTNTATLSNVTYEVYTSVPATNAFDSRRMGTTDTLALVTGYTYKQQLNGEVGLTVSSDALRSTDITLGFRTPQGAPLTALGSTTGLYWLATVVLKPLEGGS